MGSSLYFFALSRKNNCVAIKILNGYASQLNREDKLQELKVLQRLSCASPSPLPAETSTHSGRLLTHFYHPGIEEDGEHLCLVMKLLGSDVQAFRENLPNHGYLPLPIVKRILRHVLLGIAHAHARGIAHTDIKPDNIMMDLGSSWTTEAITAWLQANPPQTHPPERSLNKMVTSFVIQSLPHPSISELASGTFRLADWGSAQLVDHQTTDDITPLGLRPPEVVLSHDWDESVDIWTYGCIVFNTLTNRPLFKPMELPEKNATEEEVLLYQMISFCGEFFHEDFLRKSARSLDFFFLNCKLKKFDRYGRKTFQECINDSGFPFSTEEIEEAAAFMHKCLRLDPKNRASAVDLLKDPWLAS
ncbi:kinase-like protein [Leucogyrophana mollusca]|uniref:Kinase-like protein n=1 Tax=Leucogyrophana mollusca TaxID=85980 RepID=A0ACB8B0K4_9AGAM|nr:kinase-like protein [Leucogyrophana mollusca]